MPESVGYFEQIILARFIPIHPRLAAPLLAALATIACGRSPESRLRDTLARQTTGTIRLSEGIVEISSELTLAPGAHDLEIAGAPHGSLLKASPAFHGRALLVLDQVKNIRLHDFSMEGNREGAGRALAMAPPENYFRLYYPDNGILADRVDGLTITGVHLAHVTNFPILVSRSTNIKIVHADVRDSGSRNAMGRNNLSGGILIEEGSSHFEVRDSVFQNIAGNALWTHSLRITHAWRTASSPAIASIPWAGTRSNRRGDTRSRRGQHDHNIGFPPELVDVEHGGTPAAIDTAGNVDASFYQRNHLSEINGKCFDLDGFHDGAVRDNSCVNQKPAAPMHSATSAW